MECLPFTGTCKRIVLRELHVGTGTPKMSGQQKPSYESTKKYDKKA
jgi:hypothetical protein